MAQEFDSLILEDRVHKRVYTDPAIFELEMQRVWGRAWLFACHESQIPKPHDFFTLTLGRQPIIVARDAEGEVHGFFNRCTHRGAMVCNDDETGNAKLLTCPYHGWGFKCSGELVGVPYRAGYAPGFLKDNAKDLALAKVPRLGRYRGFVFVSFANDGVPFDEFVVQLSGGIDNLLDRTPHGAVEVRGVHKYGYSGNWKQQIENALDEYHPIFAHASTLTNKGRQIRRTFGHEEEEGMIMMSEHEDAYKEEKSYFDGGGVRGLRYGQAYLANSHKSWAGDLVDKDYRQLMIDRHGAQRFAEIEEETHIENAVFYPNLIFRVTGNIHLRVVKPIAVDRSEVWVWPLVPSEAPEYVQKSTLRFGNMHTSPASLIQTDDLEVFERIQKGLQAQSPEWVVLARGVGREIKGNRDGELIAEGTWETGMRTQFAYWRELMAAE